MPPSMPGVGSGVEPLTAARAGGVIEGPPRIEGENEHYVLRHFFAQTGLYRRIVSSRP